MFTSGLRQLNDKSVLWGFTVSQAKKPLEPPTSQSNRQWLRSNALWRSFSLSFFALSVFVSSCSHLPPSVKQEILHSLKLLISLTGQSGTVNLVFCLGWSDSSPGRLLSKHRVWNLSRRGQNETWEAKGISNFIPTLSIIDKIKKALRVSVWSTTANCIQQLTDRYVQNVVGQ